MGWCRAQVPGSGQGQGPGQGHAEWRLSDLARGGSSQGVTTRVSCEHKNIFQSQTLSSAGLGALPEGQPVPGKRKGLAGADAGWGHAVTGVTLGELGPPSWALSTENSAEPFPQPAGPCRSVLPAWLISSCALPPSLCSSLEAFAAPTSEPLLSTGCSLHLECPSLPSDLCSEGPALTTQPGLSPSPTVRAPCVLLHSSQCTSEQSHLFFCWLKHLLSVPSLRM